MAPHRSTTDRRRVLFVCGSINQTTQMHQVARELPEHEHAFTPHYCDGPLEWARRRSEGLEVDYRVASDGYRDHFVARGVPRDRIAVTGIPNFDDCRRFLRNDFPHRGYVLVCTSDARETLKRDDRHAFLRRAVGIAAGRPLVFKLHPNENQERAVSEIRAAAPGALVFARGSAEEMIANCDVLVTQYSSTVFVGLAFPEAEAS